jgi:hypothetical protein
MDRVRPLERISRGSTFNFGALKRPWIAVSYLAVRSWRGDYSINVSFFLDIFDHFKNMMI